MGLLTKLEAVNRILLSAGRSPVNSLSGTVVSNSIMAESELDNQCRKIQTQGLSYNAVLKQYSPDSSGRISLPSDTLSADGAKDNATDQLSVRGGSSPYLYDMENDTSVFTASVWLRVVRQLDFEDMPDADQEWAVEAASYAFMMSTAPDDAKRVVLEQRLQTARAKARAEEIRRLDFNLLDSDSSMRLGSRRLYRRGTGYN